MEQTNLSGKVLLVSELPNPVNPETIEVLLKENDKVFTIYAVTKEGDRASLLTDDVVLPDENGIGIIPKKLAKVEEGVTELPDNILKNKGYTIIQLPSTLITIGNSALSGNKLTSVTIPDSVQTIGDFSFSDNQLTSVTIPDSVQTIGSYSFIGNQLTQVEVGQNTEVQPYAFDSSVTITRRP